MFIDFHIHYLPNLVPEEKILEDMDKYGVEKSVVMATPDHPRYTLLNLTGTNEESWKLVCRHPKRFIMAAYIEPRNVMEAQTQIDRYYDKGVRFVKMWPGHGFSPDDPMIYPVWEKLNDLKMGVILHMGMLGVRPQLGAKVNRMAGMNAKFGQPVLLDQPARMFPDVTFIIAHTAYPWTLEALDMSFMFENIYIDFSCGLGYEAYNLIDRLHPGRLPWERFLFASDTGGNAGPFVERWSELMKEPFFAPHAEDFFYNNGRKLLERLGAV
ncbi:MAG: amidohydrolase family protein [Lentisphaeria bacterium]